MEKPVVLVTGGSRGIGLAAVVALAGAGYRVGMMARSAADLEAAAEIAGLGEEDRAIIAGDVSEAEACREAVEKCLAKFGRLDAVVHAAGVAPVRSIEAMEVEEWRKTIDTNLSAGFYLMKYAWKHLKGSGFRGQGSAGGKKDEGGGVSNENSGGVERGSGGCVVLISSLAARDPFAGFGAYGAAKAGVNLLGLMGAREGQSEGIRVHVIAPGAVETAMFREIASEAQWPREKTLAPETVAGVILDCVTGRLAATAGEVIYVHRTI